uniref:Cyclic nucleotide-binding domain-containing protein n=1 Tax=Angiostrongylus cantonensis TaxID=6313 RepID=A0A158PBC6_ANGCA
MKIYSDLCNMREWSVYVNVENKRVAETMFTFDPLHPQYFRGDEEVSVAFVYNLLFVIARQVFVDLIGPTAVAICVDSSSGRNITRECTNDQLMNMQVMPAQEQYLDMGWSRWWWIRLLWAIFDLIMDLIYCIDMFFRTRTGFLEQGLVVRDIDKIKKRYYASKQFKYDVVSWPWPFSWFRPFPVVRLNRLFRLDRVRDCIERTETRSSMPNAFRVLCVVWYIIVIIHWNACFYFWISEMIGLGTDGWVYGPLNKQSLPENVKDTLLRRYIYSFYWSTLILTTIGEVPGPVQNIEYLFVTLDLMCGVLIFATIVGNLEARVIKWFDYLWANKQSLSDQQVLKVLPDKLQAEIAMQVHFETLRKVRIFQDCEAGLLAELVLKLQLQVFSPGDYICRKGDIGREMYIVKRGKLQVVGDDGQKVFATLQEGAVFGELSILNIAGSKNGNRRTANVRSVGYTDLFVLNKNDLWNALREYPDARKLLLAKGRELLKKDNLLDENAPEEQQTVEELAEQLNNSVKVLQTRLAHITKERFSSFHISI